jgi:hypothetical protein
MPKGWAVSEKGTGGSELSIWDSKESEFTSGQRFVQDLSYVLLPRVFYQSLMSMAVAWR